MKIDSCLNKLQVGGRGSYAGVGARKITSETSKMLVAVGFFMTVAGFKLKSGASYGSDTSYEYGCRFALDLLAKTKKNNEPIPKKDSMQIYLPWRQFNGKKGEEFTSSIHPEAGKIASQHHEFWDTVSKYQKLLLSRDVMQVLGEHLDDKVNFVICYTSDGVSSSENTTRNTGGTGHTIRIADSHNIPIFNMNNPTHKARILNWINAFNNEIKKFYSIDLLQYVHDRYDNYTPFNAIVGDIVNYDTGSERKIIIHACSCFNTNGAGLAKDIFKQFPDAKKVDNETKKGDKQKLGSYTYTTANKDGREIVIINAYTQYKWGREENTLYTDYDAVRKVFTSINNDFNGGDVLIPKFGSGLAQGCWITVSNIIKSSLDSKFKITHIKKDSSMDYEPIHDSVENKQISLF